eukprot:763652-Hanusia_phi.AAC.2
MLVPAISWILTSRLSKPVLLSFRPGAEHSSQRGGGERCVCLLLFASELRQQGAKVLSYFDQLWQSKGFQDRHFLQLTKISRGS